MTDRSCGRSCTTSTRPPFWRFSIGRGEHAPDGLSVRVASATTERSVRPASRSTTRASHDPVSILEHGERSGGSCLAVAHAALAPSDFPQRFPVAGVAHRWRVSSDAWVPGADQHPRPWISSAPESSDWSRACLLLGVTEGTRTPDLQGRNLRLVAGVARASQTCHGGDLRVVPSATDAWRRSAGSTGGGVVGSLLGSVVGDREPPDGDVNLATRRRCSVWSALENHQCEHLLQGRFPLHACSGTITSAL
jgi:hypothetical protein